MEPQKPPEDHGVAADAIPTIPWLTPPRRGMPTPLYSPRPWAGGVLTGLKPLDSSGGIYGLTLVVTPDDDALRAFVAALAMAAICQDPLLGVVQYSFKVSRKEIWNRTLVAASGVRARSFDSPCLDESQPEALAAAQSRLHRLTEALDRTRAPVRHFGRRLRH